MSVIVKHVLNWEALRTMTPVNLISLVTAVSVAVENVLMDKKSRLSLVQVILIALLCPQIQNASAVVSSITCLKIIQSILAAMERNTVAMFKTPNNRRPCRWLATNWLRVLPTTIALTIILQMDLNLPTTILNLAVGHTAKHNTRVWNRQTVIKFCLTSVSVSQTWEAAFNSLTVLQDFPFGP